MVPFLDAHVHFYDVAAPGLSWPWIKSDFHSAGHSWTDESNKSRRSPATTRFTAREYLEEVRGAGVAGVVHAHSATASDDPSQETEWLGNMANGGGWPHSIIGRGHLASADGPALLRRHRDASSSCHSVRDMTGPEGIDLEACSATLRAAADMGFSIELRTAPEQFGTFTALADAFPDITFVLSHAGLPRERSAQSLQLWTEAATKLANRPNWVCKLSALCGGSDPDWTVESIRPWALACYSVFGPDRLMLGSNWPVDRLFGSYLDVVNAYREIFDHLDESEKCAVFYSNAAALYNIPLAQLD